MRTYILKHIEIEKVYKPNYKGNDLNSNNKMKIMDRVLNKCVNESLTRNRLLSRGRGINEMRVSSCKLRIENLNKNSEAENSSLYFRETLDNNLNSNEISIMQKISDKYTSKNVPKSATISNKRIGLYKGSSLIYVSSDINPNLAFRKLNLAEKAQTFNRNSQALPNENEEIKNIFNNGIISKLGRNSSSIHQQLSLNIINDRKSINGKNSNDAVKLKNKGSSVFLNFKRASFLNSNFGKKSDLIEEEESQKNNNRPNSVVSKFRIDPLITKSANKWINYKKSLEHKYSTGNFKLPLVSNLLY